MSRKLKICILSESAYSSFTGKGDLVGGSELQLSLLAKKLAKKSHDVSLVTFEKSSSSSELIEGVKVLNAFYNRNVGYVYLFPHNTYKLMKILNKIDADIYIKKGYTPLTGIIAFYTKLTNKRFLFVASSERDVSNNLHISTLNNLKNIFYRFGVKNCSLVICQTNHQKNLLKQKIEMDGHVIKNLYSLPNVVYKQKKSSNLKILWVGRLTREKRVESFLKLAKKLPDYNFWIIAVPREPEYFREIKKATENIKNLDFIGFVHHDKINEYYRASSIYINTSPSEGFPNTFLEAWGNSIPVISLGFDPDEIICERGLGFHVENFNDLVKSTITLQNDNSLRKKMGGQGRKYVEKEHDVDSIIKEYEKLIKEIIKR